GVGSCPGEILHRRCPIFHDVERVRQPSSSPTITQQANVLLVVLYIEHSDHSGFALRRQRTPSQEDKTIFAALEKAPAEPASIGIGSRHDHVTSTSERRASRAMLPAHWTARPRPTSRRLSAAPSAWMSPLPQWML